MAIAEGATGVKDTVDVPKVCDELRSLQRQRVQHMGFRIKISNRLQAIVAGTLGYHSGMNEAERKKAFKEAAGLVKSIVAGDADGPIVPLVLTAHSGMAAFEEVETQLEKSMLALVGSLPVSKWVEQPAQRGLGLLSLAVIIGEAGNLANYPNPGKLWARMGCAPYTKDGVTQMAKTWRTKGGLHAEDWTEYGYCPRRRAIMYVIGENLIKQNGLGPYRQRYDATKARLQDLHPDYSKGRCHNHGMLLAAKLLLKNLWIEWNDGGGFRSATERECAPPQDSRLAE